MNDGAIRLTFEDVLGKYAPRDGLVVDTRFNRGGDLAQTARCCSAASGSSTNGRRSQCWFRTELPQVYAERVVGERSELLGMPAPGTRTFAGWESVQEGIRWGVPGLGAKDAITGRVLENLHTEPDVLVMNEYDKVNKGQDQQSMAAIEALMRPMRR